MPSLQATHSSRHLEHSPKGPYVSPCLLPPLITNMFTLCWLANAYPRAFALATSPARNVSPSVCLIAHVCFSAPFPTDIFFMALLETYAMIYLGVFCLPYGCTNTRLSPSPLCVSCSHAEPGMVWIFTCCPGNEYKSPSPSCLAQRWAHKWLTHPPPPIFASRHCFCLFCFVALFFFIIVNYMDQTPATSPGRGLGRTVRPVSPQSLISKDDPLPQCSSFAELPPHSQALMWILHSVEIATSSGKLSQSAPGRAAAPSV